MSIRIPTPTAVRRFSASQAPEHVMQAAADADRAEEWLEIPISLSKPALMATRERVLAQWHRADKVLSASPLRPEKATEALS
ncbi:hypothetical protein ABZ636_03645 [Streptomyces sp. NPDC007251]|uniref:hypothetical protein n=1 Tax=Streptomyces sp. NPDC007251 TaxID=3154483 RepID=UPI0033D82CAD